MSISFRLKEWMSVKEINASELAALMNIQASSISHILSGRNNPSTDFIIKLKIAYPTLDLDWFLIGKEKSESPLSPTLPFPSNNSPKSSSENSTKEIERIILFYKDGSFTDHQP